MNRTYILVGLLAVLATALVVIPYVYYFGEWSISLNPVEWGSFGDYIGGLLNPILSFFALVGLLLTLHETNTTNKRQWAYLQNDQKKREWLLAIEHTEKQIRKLITKLVERKDGVNFELGSALKQVAKITQSNSSFGDRDYSAEVIRENWSHLDINSFNAICSLLGALAYYLERYSLCLMEENRVAIIGHYNSSYIGYVTALQWMGVMRGKDSEQWTKLLAIEAAG